MDAQTSGKKLLFSLMLYKRISAFGEEVTYLYKCI